MWASVSGVCVGLVGLRCLGVVDRVLLLCRDSCMFMWGGYFAVETWGLALMWR